MLPSFAQSHKQTNQRSTREAPQPPPDVRAQALPSFAWQPHQKRRGRLSSLPGSGRETEARKWKAPIKAAETDLTASGQGPTGDD